MERRPGRVSPASSREHVVLRKSSDLSLDKKDDRNRTRGDQHSSRLHAFSLVRECFHIVHLQLDLLLHLAGFVSFKPVLTYHG